MLLIDQFEEAFVACRDEAEREAFFDALVEGAGDPDERAGRRARDPRRLLRRAAPSTPSSRRWSAPTRSWSGRCAATSCGGRSSCPRAGPGCGSSRGLVSALVGDVAGEPGGLPLLSAALVELWQRRDGRTLRYRGLRAKRRRRAARSRAWPRTPTSASARPSGSGRGRCCCASPATTKQAEAFVRRRVPLDELELERDPDAARALAVLTEAACSPSTRARSRSPTRRCFASGRGCAAGSRPTPRAGAFTST